MTSNLTRTCVLGLVAVLLGSAPLALAQSQPGGPAVPDHQRGQPSTTGPQPPRSALPDWVLHGAYNGPSTKPPAGMAVPRTDQERQAALQALQRNPSIPAAAAAARAQVAATVDATRRVFETRTFPLPSDPAAGTGRRYQVPAARSDVPEGALHLLSANTEASAAPSDEPAAAPLDEPSLQTLGGIWCFIYEEWGGPKLDAYGDDYLTARAVNYCPNANNTGGEIRYMAVSMHVYKCSAYFVTWDICLGPYHYYELWPPCEQGSSAYPYLFCPLSGQRIFYPGGDPYRGAYFLRAYGYTELWAGGYGSDYQDSHNLAYRCIGLTIC